MTTTQTTITLPLEAAQIVLFKSKDATRPLLNGLHVDLKRNYIASCDGFRLARLPITPQTSTEGWPDTFTLPADAVTSIIKQAARNERVFYVDIIDATTVRLSVLGKAGLTQTVAALIPGDYPTVDHIFPREEPSDTFYMDPKMLGDSLLALHKAGCQDVRIMRRPGITSPVVIQGQLWDGKVMSVVIMPMVASGKWDAIDHITGKSFTAAAAD